MPPVPSNDDGGQEHRPRRINRRLPIRYRDIHPEPLLPLPASFELPRAQDPPLTNAPETRSSSVTSLVDEAFRSPRNIFGLIREYFSKSPPTHDPEENLNAQDLSDETDINPTAPNNFQEANLFSPYPNKNSFLLGDWYWNHGVQKSRDSFNELINIVSSPEFRPDDVKRVHWRKIDARLGRNSFDQVAGDDNEGEAEEWVDEDVGWTRTPISIPVPFHQRTKTPGQQNYVVGDLYHRSLVGVIREKLSNSADIQHFHFDPFKLFWDATGKGDDVRVHGELYSSPAFLEAHQALQESAREPGCDLPRVVVAMMFWSDATHLTSFGTAKLWPCYLYFGNESKYRRCKPSCNLCNHVAYFEAASHFDYLFRFSL